jgi:hypothetical protein
LELYAKWDESIEAKIEAVLQNGPEPRINFRELAPLKQRREVAVFDNKNKK